jgi:P-type E1-E2 ATPase
MWVIISYIPFWTPTTMLMRVITSTVACWEIVLTIILMRVAISLRVLRDGTIQTIPTAEIVPGDILVIEEGDTIAADARVLEATTLRLAEAALTGESVPVSKKSASIEQEVGIGDQGNMLFSSTAMAAGSRVEKIDDDTSWIVEGEEADLRLA